MMLNVISCETIIYVMFYSLQSQAKWFLGDIDRNAQVCFTVYSLTLADLNA